MDGTTHMRRAPKGINGRKWPFMPCKRHDFVINRTSTQGNEVTVRCPACLLHYGKSTWREYKEEVKKFLREKRSGRPQEMFFGKFSDFQEGYPHTGVICIVLTTGSTIGGQGQTKFLTHFLKHECRKKRLAGETKSRLRKN
jgi:hypothetical protein